VILYNSLRGKGLGGGRSPPSLLYIVCINASPHIFLSEYRGIPSFFLRGGLIKVRGLFKILEGVLQVLLKRRVSIKYLLRTLEGLGFVLNRKTKLRG